MPKTKVTFEEIHSAVYANITKAIVKDGSQFEHGLHFYEVVTEITQSSIDLAMKLIEVEEENARLRAYIQQNEVKV